jgi:hypothetical protein
MSGCNALAPIGHISSPPDLAGNAFLSAGCPMWVGTAEALARPFRGAQKPLVSRMLYTKNQRLGRRPVLAQWVAPAGGSVLQERR